VLFRSRADFIRRAEAAAAEAHAGMTGGAERLSLKYRPNIAEPDAYAERLFASRERDLLFGSTCVGVHKDDVVFHINGCEAKVYGSQGQQRTAALSVKLAGIELIMERLLRAPVLLLDDVLSELDESRQAYLLKRIDGLQTFLACTGVEDVIRRIGGAGNAALMRIENGTLITEGVL
jgi:DNA replication and repair protein RecF